MIDDIMREITLIVDQCPFCKSFYLIHQITNDMIICTSCGKQFTKQEAEEITGIVKMPYPNPLRRM